MRYNSIKLNWKQQISQSFLSCFPRNCVLKWRRAPQSFRNQNSSPSERSRFSWKQGFVPCGGFLASRAHNTFLRSILFCVWVSAFSYLLPASRQIARLRASWESASRRAARKPWANFWETGRLNLQALFSIPHSGILAPSIPHDWRKIGRKNHKDPYIGVNTASPTLHAVVAFVS